MNRYPISSKSETDWQRLDAMTDHEIDYSDCPEITPEQFAKAVVRHGLPIGKSKAQVTLRIDIRNWATTYSKPYRFGDVAGKVLRSLREVF